MPNRNSGFEGAYLFKIDVTRKYAGDAEHRSITRFFGDWRETAAAVFVDGQPLSSGALKANSWGASHMGSGGTYEWGATWAGDLTPGMELHFALMSAKPDAEVGFVVDRASLAPK